MPEVAHLHDIGDPKVLEGSHRVLFPAQVPKELARAHVVPRLAGECKEDDVLSEGLGGGRREGFGRCEHGDEPGDGGVSALREVLEEGVGVHLGRDEDDVPPLQLGVWQDARVLGRERGDRRVDAVTRDRLAGVVSDAVQGRSRGVHRRVEVGDVQSAREALPLVEVRAPECIPAGLPVEKEHGEVKPLEPDAAPARVPCIALRIVGCQCGGGELPLVREGLGAAFGARGVVEHKDTPHAKAPPVPRRRQVGEEVSHLRCRHEHDDLPPRQFWPL
mmetsp:Transcript_41560/g.98508  ORF Transcript_41560/g.98508 Transcript_41560/m.98508 type:complete len:275 (-) Transcript_41560:315-1139(-)